MNHNPLGHIPHKFGGIQFIIRASRLEDLALLLQCKVLVGVGRVNVFGVQIQAFVMGNDTGVAKVVNAGQSLGSHGKTCREHFREYCHGVGNVHDAFILDNFGNEIAMAQIVTNGHAHP